MAHMRRGRFEEAWRISDAVLARRAGQSCAHLPLHEQWLGTGESLRGKRVLIRCQHGLGDTVQFLRYISLVRRIARGIVLQAQEELLPLLGTLRQLPDELWPLNTKVTNYDIAVEVMELPHLFRTTLGSIPAEIPYFDIAPAALRTKRNVGLVWAAGRWDERRSIPYHLLRELAGVTDVQWYILQRGGALDEWRGEFGLNGGSDDVLEAARVIAGLDLLISVDSLPAHLGGALGVPTWTLLHAAPDWRWMLGRNDSPWYPTMRLFRQSRPGDWPPVIRAVRKELGDYFGSSRRQVAAAALG